jgi:molybdate transport system substrate-binding protein
MKGSLIRPSGRGDAPERPRVCGGRREATPSRRATLLALTGFAVAGTASVSASCGAQAQMQLPLILAQIPPTAPKTADSPDETQPGQPFALIAASSDLGPVLKTLAKSFEIETGTRLDLDLAAPRVLGQQLLDGENYDLIISPDHPQLAALAVDGALVDSGTLFVEGRLTILINRSNVLAANLTQSTFNTALREKRIYRIAVAKPDDDLHGHAALDVLNQIRLMDFARPRMVFAQDVAEAAQMVVSGAVDAGIVATSLTLSDAARTNCRALSINPSWHRKLSHRIAMTPDPDETARAIFNYLQSPPALALLRNAGYGTPN